MRNAVRDARVSVSLLVLLSASAASAATPSWTLRLGAGLSDPDATFSARRPNGKVVSTSATTGRAIEVSAERRSGRWGLLVGVSHTSSHELVLLQEFPDGTSFTARDWIDVASALAGVVFRLVPDRRWDLRLELAGTWNRFSDPVLLGAGPPFDRSTPLDIATEDVPGAAFRVGFDMPWKRGGWSVGGWVGVHVLGLRGEFPPENLEGDAVDVGDLDLRWNPVGAGLHLSWRRGTKAGR